MSDYERRNLINNWKILYHNVEDLISDLDINWGEKIILAKNVAEVLNYHSYFLNLNEKIHPSAKHTSELIPYKAKNLSVLVSECVFNFDLDILSSPEGVRLYSNLINAMNSLVKSGSSERNCNRLDGK